MRPLPSRHVNDSVIIALVALAGALLLWEHIAQRSREIDERIADAERDGF